MKTKFWVSSCLLTSAMRHLILSNDDRIYNFSTSCPLWYKEKRVFLEEEIFIKALLLQLAILPLVTDRELQFVPSRSSTTPPDWLQMYLFKTETEKVHFCPRLDKKTYLETWKYRSITMLCPEISHIRSCLVKVQCSLSECLIKMSNSILYQSLCWCLVIHWVLLNFLSSKQSYYLLYWIVLTQRGSTSRKNTFEFCTFDVPRKSCAKKYPPVVLKRVELRQISGALPRIKKDL